jgi:hypothetical protein
MTMKKLVTAAGLALLATIASTALAPGAFAQAQNGRGAGLNKVGIGYYKVPPGRQDEWLDLYQKWHRPIMQENLRTGATLSSRLYVAGNHAPGQPWDFAIVNVSAANPPKGLPSRAQVIKRLFPDQEAYVAGERARWALTINHWDEELVPLAFDQKPFSVFHPIENPKEPE